MTNSINVPSSVIEESAGLLFRMSKAFYSLLQNDTEKENDSVSTLEQVLDALKMQNDTLTSLVQRMSPPAPAQAPVAAPVATIAHKPSKAVKADKTPTHLPTEQELYTFVTAPLGMVNADDNYRSVMVGSRLVMVCECDPGMVKIGPANKYGASFIATTSIGAARYRKDTDIPVEVGLSVRLPK